jgi:glycerophosphoryl diester phosphodiesterase
MRILIAAGVVALTACSTDDAPRTAASSINGPQLVKSSDEPVLLARAILPSNAYQPGPGSGAFITGDNGVTPPFPGQPIPGFSAVLDAGQGAFYAMPDNGYGAKTNSGDFLLRLYKIRPDFKTADGGSGSVNVLGFAQLRDPDNRIPFALFRPDQRDGQSARGAVPAA